MNKSRCKTQINTCLRKALNKYHSTSRIAQEKLAEKLRISSRACSALQNGKSGFSAFSVLAVFSLLSRSERILLLTELCEIFLNSEEEAA